MAVSLGWWLFRTVSAVYVNNVQSFSMFDNKIRPFTHGYRFSKEVLICLSMLYFSKIGVSLIDKT
jgi:hypothetical protein